MSHSAVCPCLAQCSLFPCNCRLNVEIFICTTICHYGFQQSQAMQSNYSWSYEVLSSELLLPAHIDSELGFIELRVVRTSRNPEESRWEDVAEPRHRTLE